MTGVWADLGRALRTSAPYRRLREQLGEAVRLPLPAAAWVAGLLAEDLGRRQLVVVPHEADALAWVEMATLLAGPGRAVYLPAPALTPYQEGAASLHVRAQEVVALARLLPGAGETEAVVATPRSLFQRLPTPASLRGRIVEVRAGEEWPRELLVEHLVASGYLRVDLVAHVAELSVRGGVVDVFPPGADWPLRLDFFGDTVESVRRFDPLSQRSAEAVAAVQLLPLTLFPAGREARQSLAEALSRRLGDAAGLEALERVRGLARGETFTGWEALLPLAAEETVGVADLLPGALAVAVDPPTLLEEARHYAERVGQDFQARLEHGDVTASPAELLQPLPRVESLIAGAELRIAAPSVAAAAAVDFAATSTDVLHGQLPRLRREVDAARLRGERFLLVVEPEHRERAEELLVGREVPLGPGGAELLEGELTRGFRLPAAGVTVYGEPQLVPRRATPQRRRPGTRYGPFISSLRDLKLGDYVVHSDHGIGQFVGLRTVGGGESEGGTPPSTVRQAAPVDGFAVEVMEIAYAGDRTLLLPLSRIEQVQKYSGIEGVAPRLDQLGGSSWNRTRARVGKSLRQLAVNLLELYAERQLAQAPAMGGSSDLEAQFAAAFAFDETEDQLEAIAAIAEDLRRERPMDRLLCGDVGFGKTEVAMRAAFTAVEGGYQVAVLAPTTILADQHLGTFRRRFAGFPVEIDMISRFRTPQEIRDVKRRAAAGKIDILIGTHRLLSADVSLPRLALLVIDEEQRFGVAQKEKLRDLKKSLHVLAMSATPVPRTLQMSLAGVRDLSVIETPPRDRMAVETAVLPATGEVVREAIEYELERGGQVYYVYNRVEDIERVAAWLQELVPGMRVTVGHGQMDEQELARRMHAFTAGDYDLLLATTIIENGIHIPRVNTMLVHRAERFGLAQLYQLRGRVGRAAELAYCYLLVPADRVLSQDARKRLDALRDFSELGAGFRIAARDLEIRGAGNLLGAEQSGHIVALGIETYMKMLEEAIRELRGEAVEEAPSTTLDLPVAMAIPVEYIDNPNLRMEVYRRIAAADGDRDELLAELRDRFGPPPQAVYQLLEVAHVKRLAEALRVQSLTWQGGELALRLRRDSRIEPERLVELVAEHPAASFSPAGVLSLRPEPGTSLLDLARNTLERLAS
ncbi:MAG TPA: transcription-repair coupling factor [Thermoanaerobaculia bacterium]|nr:transcription-repair coupling factor [Thermoanaerobaculia bacterium]